MNEIKLKNIQKVFWILTIAGLLLVVVPTTFADTNTLTNNNAVTVTNDVASLAVAFPLAIAVQNSEDDSSTITSTALVTNGLTRNFILAAVGVEVASAEDSPQLAQVNNAANTTWPQELLIFFTLLVLLITTTGYQYFSQRKLPTNDQPSSF